MAFADHCLLPNGMSNDRTDGPGSIAARKQRFRCIASVRQVDPGTRKKGEAQRGPGNRDGIWPGREQP